MGLAFGHILSRFQDAVLTPDAWPDALRSLTDAIGTAGAAYFVADKRTGEVMRASFSGISAEFEPSYVGHYASLDVYTPLLAGDRGGRWLRLTECVPETTLRKDEWYNDFVRRCGVADIIGVRLCDSRSHLAFLGIHEEIGQPSLAPGGIALLQELLEPLSKVTQLENKLHDLGQRAAIATRTIEQLAAAVIVSDGNGRVIEMNALAQRIVRRADGLTIRHGRLAAGRAFESARLSDAIAAAGRGGPNAVAERALIARLGSQGSYILSVTPLPPRQGEDRPLVLILVTDPETRAPSQGDLAALFGLSPAEGRLAAALL